MTQNTSFNVKDTISYECEAGYGLKSGSQQRTCGQDGQWSGNPPVCGNTEKHEQFADIGRDRCILVLLILSFFL